MLRDKAPKMKDLSYAVKGKADYRKLGNFLLPFVELDHLEIDCPDPINDMDVDPPELIKSLIRMTKLVHLAFRLSPCLTHRVASADWSRVPLEFLQVASPANGVFLSSSFEAHSLAAMLPQFADTLIDVAIMAITPPSFDAFDGLPFFTMRTPAPPSYNNPFHLPHLKRLDYNALDSDHAILQAFRTCPIEDVLVGQLMGRLEDEPTLSVLKGWEKTLRKVRLAKPSRTGTIEKYAAEVGAKLDAEWFKTRGALKGQVDSDDETDSSGSYTDSEGDSEEDSEENSGEEKDDEAPWMKDLSEEDRNLLKYADNLVCMTEYGQRRPGKEVWSVAEFKRKLGLKV